MDRQRLLSPSSWMQEICPTSDKILNSLRQNNLFCPIVRRSPLSLSRSEGDGCAFSLITAIITQWWHNKLSNNYSLSPLFLALLLPPTQSQQKPFRAQTQARHLFQLLRNKKIKKKNYKTVIRSCCTSVWKQDQHRGGNVLPAEHKMLAWWHSITPNLQCGCRLNLRSQVVHRTHTRAQIHRLVVSRGIRFRDNVRIYWMLERERQGSTHVFRHFFCSFFFFSRDASLFPAIAVGEGGRRCSLLGPTEYRLCSFVSLASEQNHISSCSALLWGGSTVVVSPAQIWGASAGF